MPSKCLISWLTTLPTISLAISLDLSSQASIKAASSTIASRMMSYYSTNNGTVIISGIPGELPFFDSPPYYWWETGEMFMSLIDYWYYTNDTTYNSQVTDGMLFQAGPNADYMPQNQTKDLGNDDQVFWAFAAMNAAELRFPDPPPDQPQWLALAQAVFNTQALRWDTSSCGGGLRWQISSLNNGYDYKNSASNMGLFNLAARLGAYTHNTTYLDWAEKVWNWTTTIGLISDDFHVWDGSDDTLNCTRFNNIEWTYTSGMAIHGASIMYSATNRTIWKDRTTQLWNVSAGVFFTSEIMTEVACEQNDPVNCNNDQRSFKATYSRFLAATTKYAPWLYDSIIAHLATSAAAAAAQCVGTPGTDSCGTLWTTGTWDGTAGVGQQMSALQVIQANLIKYSRVAVTNTTGGTSQGNPSAGTQDANPTPILATITMGDRAGAGILTAISIILTLLTVYWML